jgi:hypothetical protein
MNANWKNGLPWALVAALVVFALFILPQLQSAGADREAAPTSGPRYSVVETEGHNLIVTDNRTNTLYFYTIDKDAKIGSELKLRGTVDLNKVGKPGIKPTKAKKAEPKEE